MEIWIAPIISAVTSGIVLMAISRIFTRLDRIDVRFLEIDKRISKIETEIAVSKSQLQMVLDYFMPEKKKRIGE